MKLNIATILRVMAEQGLSKTELANRSGVSRQQISTIVCRGTCSPITAGKLAVGLGVPVADIMWEVQ